jgi:hypothetical protein
MKKLLLGLLLVGGFLAVSVNKTHAQSDPLPVGCDTPFWNTTDMDCCENGEMYCCA